MSNTKMWFVVSVVMFFCCTIASVYAMDDKGTDKNLQLGRRYFAYVPQSVGSVMGGYTLTICKQGDKGLCGSVYLKNTDEFLDDTDFTIRPVGNSFSMQVHPAFEIDISAFCKRLTEQLEKKILDEKKSLISQLHSRIDVLKNANNVLQTKNTYSGALVNELRRQIDQLKQTIAQLKQTKEAIHEKDQEIEKKQTKLQKTKHRIKLIKDDREKIRNNSLEQNKTILALEDTVNEKANNIISLSSRVTAVTSENRMLQQNNDALKKKLSKSWLLPTLTFVGGSAATFLGICAWWRYTGVTFVSNN